MSWPLASFAVVAVVLGAGWLAYERRRPPARMVAVVAVMAALAALGRDAFAALPDVKPITAITFVTGYALGPLPGFTVGALGMLVSNFMLGQGPYTPWQMAAWGLVGLAGAALARPTRGRLGRGGLALGCALTALAAKEVMNVYTWTLGASHGGAALLAAAGQGLPYDITDAVASLLFGLAFGPELARILTRARLRMEVTWVGEGRVEPEPAVHRIRRRAWAGAGALGCIAAGVLGAVALLEGPHPAGASAREARGAAAPYSRELSYLAASQNADGGFGPARGTPSSELYTAWAAIGIAAAGREPLSFTREGHTILDALRAEAGTLHGAGDIERTMLALRACGLSGATLPGVAGGDLATRLLAQRAADGSFADLANLTAFAVLALRAAGFPAASAPVRGAARWLELQRNADGGYGFGRRGGPSDVDDTGAVLQALVAARTGGAALAPSLRYLAHSQNLDGGFPQQRGGPSNAQSTAWAIEGIAAAGRDARRFRRGGSRSPVGYLGTLVTPEGSVRYSATGSQTPVWVTAQALTGIAQKPLPLVP
ncbi:MAG TPA: prenyltransferase/squalene oxidase repeat-containing protein [Solirubrobacteraceae bacterium]|jgi:energy-coupling factor transport system substrate-specific component|nr:prenyltransferase/squalene oxidase repeat-containing protein [Solirubrobacteraceae bacterium]